MPARKQNKKEEAELSLFSAEAFPVSSEDSFYRDMEFLKLSEAGKELRAKEFYNCKFTSCNFFKTKFIECEFEKCTFSHCDLSVASFNRAGLLGVQFDGSKLLGIDWTKLRQPMEFSFMDCKLDGGSFLRMSLPGLSMLTCSAHDCEFSEAKLIKGVFSGSDFSGSKFSGADLSASDFSEALNYSINPNQVKLKKAIFSFPEAAALLNHLDIVLK